MSNEVSRKEIITFIAIVVAMLGSLVYGFFLIKKDTPTPSPSPTTMSCWEEYQDQGEDVAIRMCEGTD